MTRDEMRAKAAQLRKNADWEHWAIGMTDYDNSIRLYIESAGGFDAAWKRIEDYEKEAARLEREAGPSDQPSL